MGSKKCIRGRREVLGEGGEDRAQEGGVGAAWSIRQKERPWPPRNCFDTSVHHGAAANYD